MPFRCVVLSMLSKSLVSYCNFFEAFCHVTMEFTMNVFPNSEGFLIGFFGLPILATITLNVSEVIVAS